MKDIPPGLKRTLREANRESGRTDSSCIFNAMRVKSKNARCGGIASVGLITLLACGKEPVAWSNVTYSYASAVGLAQSKIVVPDSLGCTMTARAVRTGGETRAVWWSVRSDSSSALMYATKANGRWDVPVAVDTLDASRRGCDRPAPALAVSRSGYIYIAYFLEPASGAGIFFAHQMDSTGFHDPISITYGKRPSTVSIAASGDRVAVGYEEPNTERGQIWVALSGSMGHIFDSRVAVSSPSAIAVHPSVRLSDSRLEVEWSELIQADSIARRRVATRTGKWNQ